MKKLFYFMMAAFAVLCVCSSCSSDDDSETPKPDTIVGTWKCVTYEGWESWDGGKDEWKDSTDEDEYWTYTFNKNGTGVSTDYWDGNKYDDDIKWSLSGNKLTIEWIDDDYDHDIDVYTIESLSSNKLVISCSGQDEDEKWYEKETYVRVN